MFGFFDEGFGIDDLDLIINFEYALTDKWVWGNVWLFLWRFGIDDLDVTKFFFFFFIGLNN